MKQTITALIFGALLSGCVSTKASIPALDGMPRVPVNKVVPETVPYAVPASTTPTITTPGE